MDANKPPRLHLIIGEGICDLYQRPCRKVNGLVTNVYDAKEDLVCVLTELKVRELNQNENKSVSWNIKQSHWVSEFLDQRYRYTSAQISGDTKEHIGEPTTTAGSLQSFTEVSCAMTHNIPKSEYKIFYLGISTNRGATHSNEHLVILAHSDCFTCDLQTGCVRTEVWTPQRLSLSCVLFNETSRILVSVLFSSTNLQNDDPACDPSESGTNIALIASLAVVCALILIVIVALVICCVR